MVETQTQTQTQTSQDKLSEEQQKKILDTVVNVKMTLIYQVTNILEVCNKRGAFQLSELEAVGMVSKVLTGAIEEAKKKVLEESKSEESTAKHSEPVEEA